MRNNKLFNIITIVVTLSLMLLSSTNLALASDYKVDRNELENQLLFDYDETVFTLYAFLNYTGFDANNGMAFSPIRQAIRNELNSKNLKLRDNSFFINQGWDRDLYDYYIKIVDGPPYFEPVFYKDVPQDIKNRYGLIPDLMNKDFSGMLAEFYEKADIHQLYEKYRPEYYKEINRFRTLAYDKIEEIFNIFKLDPNQVGEKVVYDINYLMEAGRSETALDFPDYRRGKATVMQTGPNPNNLGDGSSAAHEVLHHYVNPLLDKYEQKVKAFILSNSIGPAGPYDAYSMVDEIFVRAISCIPSGRYTNYDSIKFPRAEDIFNFYYTDYNMEADNLESFILKALDEFTDMDDSGSYQQGYDQGYDDGYEDGYNDGYKDGQDNTGQSTQIEDRSKYSVLESKKNVSINKDWKVEFNLDLDVNTIIERNVFITDTDGNIHPALYLVDRDEGLSIIRLIPSREYIRGETYTLWIKDIKSKSGSNLAKWVLMDFTIEN